MEGGYYSRFLGAILIAISEISYINHCTDRNYVHKHAYLGSGSGLCLQPHKRIHILAMTGIRVVTQEFGRKSKLKFWS
jgi:hypothetical protein